MSTLTATKVTVANALEEVELATFSQGVEVKMLRARPAIIDIASGRQIAECISGDWFLSAWCTPRPEDARGYHKLFIQAIIGNEE